MVRVVDVASVDKRVAHQRRAHEAGADAVAVLPHELGQTVPGADALRFGREQVEPQRQCVGGLGVARQATGRRDELLVERLDDLVGELLVARPAGVVAEHVGGPRDRRAVCAW